MTITAIFICIYFGINTILVILRYVNDKKELERRRFDENIQYKN